LVSWWPGDGVALDIAGNNHGTLQNGATFASGKVGSAFAFDGVDDFIQVPNNPSLHSAREMTMEGWFNASTLTPVWQNLFWKGDLPDCPNGNCKNREYSLFLSNGGNLHFTSTSADRVNVDQTVIATPYWVIEVGRWYHFAAVINSSAGKMQIFLNGTNAAEGNYSTNGLRTTSGPLTFGNGGGANFFSGKLDEFALFDRALAPNEIAAIYSAGVAGKCFSNAPSPIFVQHPVNQTGYLGATAVLPGAAMGTPRPFYQWYFNGIPLAGATNQTLTLPNLAMTNAGNYFVVASNSAGSATSFVATLSVSNIFGGYVYRRTTNFYQPHDDWRAAVRSEFGPTAEVVDWNTLKGKFADSVAVLRTLFEVVGITAPLQDEGIAVTVGGSQIWSGDRSYGVNRTDGVVPGGYLVHDQILNNWALLGSWPAERRIMTRIPAPPGSTIFSNPESFENGSGDWDTDNYALWQIGVPTSGPSLLNGNRAHSGMSVGATLLNGNYSPNTSGRGISPSFNVQSVNPGGLGGASILAVVSIRHRR